jgi:DNA polymerase-3 subunit alpha
MRYREVAASLGVETIPVDPARYLHRAEAPAYQAIRAIREATTFQDQKTDCLMHLKTREDLLEDFTEREITMAVQFPATSERLELPFQQRPLPRVAEDSNAMLRTHAEEGLLAHGHESKEAEERLAFELSIIEQTGFAAYFLIVEELIRRAKANGVHVEPCRGSGVGSLVSYALGITRVDPLKYGLLFERFLNPERISMPDIDIDIEDERREEVLEELVMRYGKDHVAQIGTLSTLGAKAALRDVGRTLEFSKDELDAAVKQLGKSTTLQGIEQNKQTYRWFSGSEKRRQLLQLAQAVEGPTRQRSVHAACVVIGSENLVETTPLETGPNERYVTQLLMQALERQGLLKIDLLGLRNLSRLRRIEELIRREHPCFTLSQIPEEDRATFQVIARAETDDIFKFESPGMKQTLREVKPIRFVDLVATMSLYCPGPMQFIDLYAKRKAGQPYQRMHPVLEEVLASKYGIIVYQEQLMEITRGVAGFTLDQADILRRAISKKSTDSLEQERLHFLEGARTNGFDDTVAHSLYEQIERFAGYGFNRRHAVAYSKISYALGYIKAHFPQIFFLVSVEQPERLARLMRERRLPVLSPDVWISYYRFSLQGKGIRLGIHVIKGISEREFERLKEASKHTATIADLWTRVGWGKKERAKIELLLYSGALDRATHGDCGLAEQEVLEYFKESSNTLLPDERAILGKRRTQKSSKRSDSDWARLERDALGFWLTYSPLTTAMKAPVESAYFHDLSVGADTHYLISYIDQIREFKTKRGQEMAVIQAVDGYSNEEVVVFQSQYERFRRSLYLGNVLLIELKVQDREGERQFILERLQPLGQDVLFVKLTSKNELAKLEQLLEAAPGDIPVVVR